MKHKKTLLTSLMMTLLTVACLFMFSACDFLNGVLDSIGLGGLFGGTNYTVTWEVDDNATLTVEGYDELPTEVAEGTQLTVSVNPTKGYEVNKFYVGTNNIPADANGKYVFKVNMDVTITVTMQEAISAVNVKSNPTKLSYYAGEELDKTGMEVEIEYETGRKETTEKYVVRYMNGTAFSLGDTSFEVVLTSKTSVKTTVDLNEAVVAKVVIDPVGGTIADAYYTALQSNTEIKNLTKDADGVISFTHAQPLTAAISLPGASQITKGEGDDYVFQGWSGAIAAGNDTSLTISALYHANLLVVEAIGYDLRDNVPYLVITGEFKAAESAYLYLYEGNDDVELNGPAVSGTRGEKFELLFDMRDLVAEDEDGAQKYIGKWMDIKFRAQFGDRVETQEINLEDYADDFCDVNEVIRYDGYEYGFKVHTPDNTTQRNLKAVASTYFDTTYTLSSSVDADNNVILIVEGKINVSEYYGKAVKIDFWVSNTIEATAPIDENGNYTIQLNLSAASLETTGYAHFKIVESVDDPTELFKDGTDGNLLNSWCVNENLNSEYNGIGIITGGAIRCANNDNSQVFYVGAGQWGGVVLYGVNEDPQAATATMTKATVEIRDGKPSYVLYGTYAHATEDMFVVDLQEMTGWSTMSITSVVNLKNDGTFEIVSDLSAIEPLSAYMLSHFIFNGNSKDVEFVGSADGIIASVAVDGKVYTARYEAASAWDRPVVLFSVREGDTPEVEVAPDYEMNAASLTQKEGRVILTVGGTYTIEKSAMEGVLASWSYDLQENPYAAGKTDWSGNWTRINTLPITKTVNDDGTWSVAIDVTDITWDNDTAEEHYTLHLGVANDKGEPADYKMDASANGVTLTYGGKVYTLTSVPGSNDGAQFWGCLGLTIVAE